MRDLLAIQQDINSTEAALQERNADDGQNEIWLRQLEGFKKELIAAETQLQNLNDRVEQAKEEGYYFDKLKTSSGIEMIDLSYSPENHELQAIAVQKGFLSQQDAFNVKLNELQYRNDSQAKIIEGATTANQRLMEENDTLRDTLNQVNLEKADSDKKLENATRIITEQEAEINRLKSLQVSADAIPVAPLSEEEKETKLMAEVMGKQIKVVGVVAINPDSFTNKMFKATNAVTGADIEDYYIYLSLIGENSRKRYEEVTPEAAEQLRADYAQKKADFEAQNNIPILEIPVAPVNDVQEEVEAKPEETFQEEVQATEPGLVESPLPLSREETTEVEPKSLDQQLAQLYEEHRALAARVEKIEHWNFGQVA